MNKKYSVYIASDPSHADKWEELQDVQSYQVLYASMPDEQAELLEESEGKSISVVQIPGIEKRALRIKLANCLILYSAGYENIDIPLIEAGVCISEGKELILAGSFDSLLKAELIKYSKGVYFPSMSDALKYVESLYYSSPQ
jgi:hypothetical protein